MNPSWHHHHIQKRYYVKTTRKQKILIFSIEFNDVSYFGHRILDAKSIKNPLQNDIQDSMPKFKPLWPENQTQDTSNTLPRRPHDAPKGRRTLQDVPKTAPGRLQDDPRTLPKRLKILSRRPQDGSKLPKTTQKCFQDAPRRPKTPPRRLQDASRPRC